MTKLLENALKAITNRTNLYTGLAHPNDMNAAKQMFTILHKVGERLLGLEVQNWAYNNNWQYDDAKELGELAESIGNGKKVRIKNRPMWKEDILTILDKSED